MKNAQISMMILEKIATGLSVREAVDAVLGEGTSKRLAEELYDEIKKRNK